MTESIAEPIQINRIDLFALARKHIVRTAKTEF